MEERVRLARELVGDLAAGETDLAAPPRARARRPPPPPSRTKWTRLVHLSVLTGHVSSRQVRAARAAGDAAAWSALGRAALRLVEDMEARPPPPPPTPLVLSGHAASLTPY